ncbi:hypothetical protein K505DRAFT_327753 [Melanomma pulvis-pyrius CBS 109.77]|uniref:Zn(2)-C6 fungal-type domain-containing protein n=1 Tax=Melanomma pulvis-pyrius CBS 109.77 TaxID=1314802 RepID=A0A6A6X213_9PLEO|nr:hypothetical protein K505DRAFT_327753 [Melanomma pulvis-pyrius CBS 109.77]
MPPKRPHKKSRNGCYQCRKRRVKCNEQRPRCTNCTHRDEECHFPLPLLLPRDPGSPNDFSPCGTPGDRSSAHRSPSDSTLVFTSASSYLYARLPRSSTNLAPLQLSSPGPIGINDLALMHYWCTRTCYSFTPFGADLFRDHVGQEALRYDYLMEALLALTLLHIASEMDDTIAAGPYVSAALQHQNRGLSGLRATLSDISPSNCDAIFASSVFIMVCAIVSPLLPAGRDDDAKSTAESMLLLVDFINGIASIVELSRKWLENGPMSTIFDHTLKQGLSSDNWFPAEELRHLVGEAVIHGSHKHQIFEQAIHELETVGKRNRSVVIWVTLVGSDFLDELRSGDLFAITIFMHWGVLLYKTSDMWWTRYSGTRLVGELSSTLVGRGEKWDKIVLDCRQQVGFSP